MAEDKTKVKFCRMRLLHLIEVLLDLLFPKLSWLLRQGADLFRRTREDFWLCRSVSRHDEQKINKLD